MIDVLNRLCVGDASSAEVPAGPPAASAPGGPPRASLGLATRPMGRPGVSGGYGQELLFAWPGSRARAGRRGVADSHDDARAIQEARAEMVRAWRDEGPRTFDTLYGCKGSLRRDVVNALWQRIEQLLAAVQHASDGAAAGTPALDAAMGMRATPTETAETATPSTPATTNAPGAEDDADGGTMTDLELHALTEQLTRAERLLGTQDSIALRAVRTLRQQVLGARASLGRPLLVASAGPRMEQHGHAGASSFFQLGTNPPLPGLPLGVNVRPSIGASYTSGVDVGDDLWIRESRTVEVRLGIIGRIRAFILKLELSLTGRHARSYGRSYYDPDHLLQAPGSSAYRAERDVAALRDLACAAGRTRLGMPKAFSLQSLDELRQAAYANHDEFVKTAAMLGILVTRPQAGNAHHPLAENHRTARGAGSPARTVTTGIKLKGQAALGGVDGDGMPPMLRVHGQLEGGGAKTSTAIRTYVPIWEALSGREAQRAGEAVTQRRLVSLRAACAPMARALQAYHGGPAPAAPVARLGKAAHMLETLSAWQPGDAPVPGADMNDALEMLAAEHDLYCQAARRGPHDEHGRRLTRSIEQAWGIKAGDGVYDYMRALAVVTALAGQHAQATGQPPPAAQEALAARLAAPAMIHDGFLMKRATGFRDILPIETWQCDMALEAGAGISLPLVDATADVGGKIRATRVAHFNALKGGDFIDVEVTVGVSGEVGLATVFDSAMAWVDGHLGHAISALAEAGVPAFMIAALNDALKGISPTLQAGARLIFAIKYSRPLADTTGSDGNAASSELDKPGIFDFNMEYVRVLARTNGALDTRAVPLATVMGRNAIRFVLMRLDNCYRKGSDPAKVERETHAYLASPSVRRDLPAIFESLAQDGSAAARQVRAFVREAIPHAADAEGMRALRSCEDDFFRAMKAYAGAAIAASAVEGGGALAGATAEQGVVLADGASAVPAEDPARTPSTPSTASSRDDARCALPEYAAAERALLALCAALRRPGGVHQDKRTVYATELGRVRASACA